MCIRNCEKCSIKVWRRHDDVVHANFVYECGGNYINQLAELNTLLVKIAEAGGIATAVTISVSGDDCDNGAKTWADDIDWPHVTVVVLLLGGVVVKDVRHMRNAHTNKITLQNCLVLNGNGDCVLDFREGFPQLYEVHANGMGLTDLSKQTRFSDDVVILGFSDNHIRDGHDVVWPRRLSAIFLDYNGIESLASFKFPRFTRQLFLSNNRLTGFGGFAAPGHLDTVFVDGNQIVHLDLNPLRGVFLEHVNASNNMIQTVTGLVSAVKLFDLALDGNPFTEVPIMYGDVIYSHYVPTVTVERCVLLSELGEKQALAFKRRANGERIPKLTIVLRYIAITLVYERMDPFATSAVHKLPLELIRSIMVKYV